MSHPKFSVQSILIGLLLGAVVTYISLNLLPDSNKDAVDGMAESKEKVPLYWVAPMDANYQRDQPGQSPMGMDLIPVYEEQGCSTGSGPGTIKISPAVVNNLGVRTETIQKQDIHTQIDTIGYVQYDEDLLVHIHPRVEGWVEKLTVKTAGNPVSKGQALYELYAPELVNAQEEYILTLKQNNSRLIRATENRLKSLQFSEQQINQLKQNRQVQQIVTFYAPQSGVVDDLNIREGHYVKPGDIVMSIGSLEDVWVEAEVFERQADLLAIGQKVTMRLDYLPGKKWTGEVDYIYPTLDSETRTLKVRLKFNNKDQQLKPNMFAQINIHTNPMNNVLVVPTEAVIRTGDSNRVVLALGDGQFKSVNVNLGRFYNQNAEVISGLKDGDKVVTSAQFLLDSESSKTSDFKRMEDAPDMPDSVWTSAIVHSIKPDHRMINASHEAIEAWDWPEMTMDFTVSEDVDMSDLKTGTKAHLQIEKTESQSYQVIGIHIQSDDENNSAMDHSEHDMSTMDHSQHELTNQEPTEHRTESQSAQPSDKQDQSKESDHMNHGDEDGADHD